MDNESRRQGVAETGSAERIAAIAALEAEYAQIAAETATARTQMLSDRLTRSRKETQLREATVEEAEDQAAYFEGRTHEMEGVVQADEAQLATLEMQAAAVVGQMAVIRVQNALAAFDAALHGLVPPVDALFAALTETAPHLQAAFAQIDILPESATETHAALAAANDRAAAVESLLHELRYALAGPTDPADGPPVTGARG